MRCLILISLTPMTIELARQYYSEFVMDPDLFLDPKDYKPYVYSPESSDERVQRYAALGRIFLAVTLDGKPIGEVVLKQIDHGQKCCTMGISLVNDRYKNQGFGTAAEKLTLRYAFEQVGMETVYADAVITNLRSRHVLEKAGFHETHTDGKFAYYRCDKHTWKG